MFHSGTLRPSSFVKFQIATKNFLSCLRLDMLPSKGFSVAVNVYYREDVPEAKELNSDM